MSVTSSSLLSFRRTNLRIPKPKTQKKKPMPNSKSATSTKNKWNSVRQLAARIIEETTVSSVTADSNVSQVKGHHLHTPAVKAKREKALKAYWERRRKSGEATKRYQERYGLKCISFRIPTELVDKFNEICDAHDLNKAETAARLIVGFIQRNTYPDNTKKQ